MSELTGKIFEFDDYRLIPDEGLLLRDGQEVQLSPKAFAMLLMLVERHGHLVKKNDILDHVWGDTFVEEGVIPQCISSIRNALGENPKAPTYIRTEPKRGYRFIGDVKVFAGTGRVSGSGTRASGRAVCDRVRPLPRRAQPFRRR
jgi:DNA-binding winged helix-turn-helix (wHTH) protein